MRPTFDTGRPAEQVLAEHLVASAQKRVHRLHAERRVVADVQPEDPVHALVRESHEAALVALGSRGRGRIVGMLLGSVSLAVAGRSHVAPRGRVHDPQWLARRSCLAAAHRTARVAWSEPSVPTPTGPRVVTLDRVLSMVPPRSHACRSASVLGTARKARLPPCPIPSPTLCT
ncbi:universal stress protein [Streptomyces sp. NPDC102437]|uniref:universal stress protein n=1 Tax=Streptomyces sp. NPDC102437 TaxID=3366175 RepID=UPI0037FBDA58